MYRFAEFVVSRTQRQVFRHGQPVPLIPRYFDLLLLLIERRPDAVSRREIFERVWNDVIVSDGALSQAIRTLRRLLGDDPREPRFIRTVSRHGYSFVFPELVEEPERPVRDPMAAPRHRAIEPEAAGAGAMETLVDRLLRGDGTEEDLRDVAEQLHAAGTADAVARVASRPGHARALALLRDTRWEVPGAGDVPLLRDREGFAAGRELVRLRVARALSIIERRWASAAFGAALAGAVGGTIGGVVLVFAPGSRAPASVVPALLGLGALAGAVGASGIGPGILAAEAIARSQRTAAVIAGATVGGLAAGAVAHYAARWILDGLFGVRLPFIGGRLEGLILGFAIGAGYAAITRRVGGGMATAGSSTKVMTALAVASCCAAAGLGLSWLGRPMIGGLINDIARASRGAALGLSPLASLIADPSFGPVMKAMMALLEAGLFGFGLTLGLMRRPRI